LFRRTRVSATIGFLGVGIMFYPHASFVPLAQSLTWVAIMIVLFGARISNSLVGLGDPEIENPRSLAQETCLCAVIGVGWGASLFVFDTNAMDQLFYLRLLILAAAMAFIISSTSVFLRLSLAYTWMIGITVAAFILSHDYVRPQGPLLFSILLYELMVSALAMSMNRSIRTATANQLAVASLTEELTHSLDTERTLRAELSRRADTDELTGVLNRRGILARLSDELTRSRRFRWQVAVLMIDIDHFKEVNDTYGHASGDLAIRAMVEAVRKELRETDALGRIGGEEFVVALPGTGQDGALIAAERIRGCVGQKQIALPGTTIQMTISIGVAVHLEQEDADRLIARADHALYAAKHKGRNRVEIDGPENDG
jgi:diguanylate cyclase (GGDEF)-like protein